MKLTGELKEKVDTVESLEEKRDIILNAGIELTDSELESVAGGKKHNEKKPERIPEYCHQCYAETGNQEHLYLVDRNVKFCTKGYHIYKNGVYITIDKSAVTSYMNR